MNSKRVWLCSVICFFAGIAAPLRGETIRWSPVQGAAQYRVEIINAAGGYVLLRDVLATSIDLPVLEPGQYRVRISVLNKFNKVDSPGEWQSLVVQRRNETVFTRFEPNRIAIESGSAINIHGENFPGGRIRVELEGAGGDRVQLAAERKSALLLTAALPPAADLEEGVYNVIVIDASGRQYRRGGLTLVRSASASSSSRPSSSSSSSSPPAALRDPLYFGAGLRLVQPKNFPYALESSTVFARDLFFGLRVASGVALELGFSMHDPIIMSGVDDSGANFYDASLLAGFDLTVTWSPEFKFFVNPVVGASFGMMDTMHSYDRVRTAGTVQESDSESRAGRSFYAALSLFLRFDLARDFWLDLGVRVHAIPHLHDLAEYSLSNITYLNSALARIGMSFGGLPSEALDEKGRPQRGHAAFGDIGIGALVSAPILESRLFRSAHSSLKAESGGFPFLWGGFLSFWLREGLQLELHYENAGLHIEKEEYFGNALAYMRVQSFALDVAWMPEYKFFIKPLLSAGLGLFSSSLEFSDLTGAGKTDKSLDLEARWALMIRIAISKFWIDAGLRMRIVDCQGAELRLTEPIVRAGFRF